ncbi:flagellar biosynthesis protein FlhB [Buchnera aphidicola (Melanaphis sacchari)]|uniref:Flagellar biosynthetic protein FlhB n=1 Tax=Buchnera aphidicola (Melanaphis sacchari) TaxID=2173854 RepID=A0A2U8DFF5_9GAMM|nr:flagellar biosynthesis protein FlhB [Buchnera aphidicola]AWH90538.1 flagellar biosynthesis protein FlhB [Buchnera aphidicola (Melanaphis sacchari)]
MNLNTNEDKTEQPTEHHIKKFQKKGKTRYSRELNSLLILISGMLGLWFLRDQIFVQFSQIMHNSFCFDKKTILLNEKNILFNLFLILKKILIIFFPFFLCLIITCVFPSILFSGIKFGFKSFQLNFKKINPLDGFKRIFSKKILIEFFKIVLKLLIITCIFLLYLKIFFNEIFLLNTKNIISASFCGWNFIVSFCFIIISGLIPVVLLDVIWQKWAYYKKIKMTRQEVKNDFKEQEGNPYVKMKIRQLMKLNLRKRMIIDVAKSDVVITNPIHYSVALKYDMYKMNAPKVVAKGVGDLAIKIQRVALKHKVPIISSPLLSRSLYRYSEIGHYIPGSLYKAVAEVLAWSWKVKKWRKEGGNFPQEPKDISIPSDLIYTGETKK